MECGCQTIPDKYGSFSSMFSKIPMWEVYDKRTTNTKLWEKLTWPFTRRTKNGTWNTIYNTLHVYACPKPGLGFLMSYVVVFFVLSEFEKLLFIKLLTISLNFLFTMCIMYTELNHIIQGRTQDQHTTFPFPVPEVKVSWPSSTFLDGIPMVS